MRSTSTPVVDVRVNWSTRLPSKLPNALTATINPSVESEAGYSPEPAVGPSRNLFTPPASRSNVRPKPEAPGGRSGRGEAGNRARRGADRRRLAGDGRSRA